MWNTDRQISYAGEDFGKISGNSGLGRNELSKRTVIRGKQTSAETVPLVGGYRLATQPRRRTAKNRVASSIHPSSFLLFAFLDHFSMKMAFFLSHWNTN
jgi:hypothetical protein